ncbi:MAG: NAD(P)-dependent oxidoreductase [Bacteroidia bacterium]|nr:NAD(P)-dependent oxidoreductase [Bacteroidia bacterium]
MKVLITGLTGFVGKNLLSAFENEVLEIVTVSRRANAQVGSERSVTVFQGTLGNKESLEPAFIGVDVVVNIAAELKDESQFVKTNIEGVRNIIELSRKHGVKRIIHLSSVGVVGMQYSDSPVIVDETFPCAPKNNYERTKLESERILLTEWSDDPKRITILRPTNVFGEQHPRKALLNFITKVAHGTRFYSTRTAMVNYVYAADLAQVIRHFIFNSGAHCIYNVGNEMSFKSFHTETAAALGTTPVLTITGKWIFKCAALFGYMGSASLKSALQTLSNEVVYTEERLRKEFPQIEKSGVVQGVCNTIEDYRKLKLLGQ